MSHSGGQPSTAVRTEAPNAAPVHGSKDQVAYTGVIVDKEKPLMKKAMTSTVIAGVLCMLSLPLQAGETAARAGAQRATSGATDAVMSPVRLVEGVQQDTAQHGAVGVVTGTVKGGARAVGQLVTGAANVGVGVVEVLVSPFSR